MIFVAYYTPGRYAEFVPAFVRSLERFRVRHSVQRVPDLGSWPANNHFKAEFLRRKLEQFYPERLVYLDVDAELEAEPLLLREISEDLGAFYLGPLPGKVPGTSVERLFGGTLFLQNNRRTRLLLEAWAAENARRPDAIDQENLQTVVERLAGAPDPLTVARLPAGYCWVEDVMKAGYPEERVIIRHFMESRARWLPGGKKMDRP